MTLRAVFMLMSMVLAVNATSTPFHHREKQSASLTNRTSTPSATEGYFTGADGVRLFYRRIGKGPKFVVFLHGGPGSNFRGNGDYVEPLARNRTVIMYDQRGSGASQLVTDAKLLTAEHHVRDLESLRQHFGIARMTLIGLSWGSGLAALYATAHPDRVDRVLFLSPISPTTTLLNVRLAKLNSMLDETTRARRDQVREKIVTASDVEAPALCRELSDIVFRLYFLTPTPEKLTHAARRCEISPAAIRNRYVVEAATRSSLGDWDFRPMLASLRMPALVMEGEKTNVPLDATREWAAALPNGRLLLIPEAGHEFFVDQPDAFIKAAELFVRGRFPAGAERVRKSKSMAER